jgi:hypothetical protein
MIFFILSSYLYKKYSMKYQEREQKAKLYESYLREHDELARKVSILKSVFDPSKEELRQIEDITKQMKLIRLKAEQLGNYHS